MTARSCFIVCVTVSRARHLLLTLLLAVARGSLAQEATPEPVECRLPIESAITCADGAPGTAAADLFPALTPGEVETIARAAAVSLDASGMTVAVVDRAGRTLAVLRKPGANPANDDLAVGVARTAAFFSHNMAPLSSRTVRFISGIHFPPGITNTPNAALYGIENTNRGCDLNIVFNEGKCLPRPRTVSGDSCSAMDRSGCGPGIVTGKRLPDDADPRSVNAGGVPLYRLLPQGLTRIREGVVSGGKLVGGVGVAGVGGDPQLAEFAAATAAFAAPGIVPVPQFPLPEPGNVFVDGIRLPFLGPDIRLAFNRDGLPTGVRRLEGTRSGSPDGMFTIGPRFGGCAPDEYLSGPRGGTGLSQSDVEQIIERGVRAARKTRGLIRLPLNSYARMVLAVADVDGSILALYRMPDATVFSIDVAVAKARNVVYFSGNEPQVRADLPGVTIGTAVTNRTLGFGSQPLYPPGIDSRISEVRPGPFYSSLFLRDLDNPCSQGTQPANPNQNGIVFFAGSTPLYRGSTLVGGLGVSGDGVEQDDYVSFLAAGELLPSRTLWADRIRIAGARLPMFKFPRHPEGVTECGGKPCD